MANKNPIWAWSTRDSKGCDPCLQNVTIEHSIFSGNFVDGSGGALGNQWSVFHVRSSIFAANSATKYGGALWNDAQSQSFFSNCTFTLQGAASTESVADPGSVIFNNGKGEVVVANESYYLVQSATQGSQTAVVKAFYLCSLQDLRVIVQG